MRAAAARVDITPNAPLPMFGFVRRQTEATGTGLPLETTLLLLEEGDVRVALIGVDTLGIPPPEVDDLRRAVADAAGAEVGNVLLNWNHTHNAPPACRALVEGSGALAIAGDERFDAYWRLLFERLVAAAAAASGRLEPAAIAWGTGEVDLSVNRRERSPDGEIVHGWRVDGLLDRQVVALQARRPDDSVIATLVGFGCHPVSVGMDFTRYSADYPGGVRERIRSWTGGECVFFQGAAGNVLPRVSFTEDEVEARRMGDRLAVEVVHALADREAWPTTIVQRFDGSLIPMILFRRERAPQSTIHLAAAERSVRLPLQPSPTEDALAAEADDYARAADEAQQRGAGSAELFGLLYHAKWAKHILEDVRHGRAPTSVEGPVHAVRIGDGVIVTGPGEVFTEIGIAVKERSPGLPTLYAGYTNSALGYFPTAAAYPEGGYEPVYSNRSYGLPAPASPDCERILVETGVRLAETLFPERAPFAGDDWSAGGAVPSLAHELIERPVAVAYAPPPTAHHPG